MDLSGDTSTEPPLSRMVDLVQDEQTQKGLQNRSSG